MVNKISNKELHWLNAGIFPATVLFSCGFTYNELEKLLKKKKADQWLKAIENDKELIDSGKNFALARHLTNIKTGKQVSFYFIILVERFKFSDYEMCVLAHEVLHICQFFLPDVIDRNKEKECEAYFHTYLMENILKLLRKK